MLQSPPPPPPLVLNFVQLFSYGRLFPPKLQSCQIAQTKCNWSSDELQNGSNNKGMIILKIKINSLVVLCEMVQPKLQTIWSDEN